MATRYDWGTILAEATAIVEIVWIKEHSGLTWDQLGKVFGVSRRAVHMWANGGRLNETNAQRLREFASIIEHLEAETPGATPEVIRARLNQIEADGYSVVGRLRQERSGGPSWGAPFGPERLVDAIRDPLRARAGEVGQYMNQNPMVFDLGNPRTLVPADTPDPRLGVGLCASPVLNILLAGSQS